MDPFQELYDKISDRKAKPEDDGPYMGGNGRIDRAVDLIVNDPRIPKSGVLLDIGGAIGNLGYSLREMFSRRIVVDISDRCRGAAESKGNEFHQANVDIEGIPFIGDSFADLVVALDFIEHILDPERFAEECRRILKPGGMVLINTPNIQYWRHLQSLVCQGIFPHTSGDRDVYHGGHVAFFTRHDIRKIFCNFVDHQFHISGPPDPCPPIWIDLLADKRESMGRLCYPDIVFSCRKPI